MSNQKSFEMSDGTFAMTPFLRLTVNNGTYTLDAIIPIPANYTIGSLIVTSSESEVSVTIPVKGSNPSGLWKAAVASCTLPSLGEKITTASIVTATVTSSSDLNGDVGGGDPVDGGSTKVTYEDAEEE